MAVSVKGSGGGGGLTSADVTASKAQVLAGYSTLTTDSNDAAIEGTIELEEKTVATNGTVLPTVSGNLLSKVTVAIPEYHKEHHR